MTRPAEKEWWVVALAVGEIILFINVLVAILKDVLR